MTPETATRPPRTASDVPRDTRGREGYRQPRITPGHWGPPVSVYGRPGALRDIPRSPRGALDTSGSPKAYCNGPDKTPARLTKAGQPGRLRLPYKGAVHTR